MGIGDDTGRAVGGDPAELTATVAEVLQAGGPAVAHDPVRLRGMLNDLLGASTRAWRAEVDAVVSVADAGLVDGLALGGDPGVAVAALGARGMDPSLATRAVHIWLGALRGLQPTEPQDGPTLPGTEPDPDPTTPDPDDRAEEQEAVGGGGPGARRRVGAVALGVAAVVVLALVAVLWLRGDDGGSAGDAGRVEFRAVLDVEPSEPGECGDEAGVGGGAGDRPAGLRAMPVQEASLEPDAYLPSKNGRRCYAVGPVRVSGAHVDRVEPVVRNGEYWVSVTFRAEDRSIVDALFDDCYRASLSCPQGTGTEYGSIAIVVDGAVVRSFFMDYRYQADEALLLGDDYSQEEAAAFADLLDP